MKILKIVQEIPDATYYTSEQITGKHEKFTEIKKIYHEPLRIKVGGVTELIVAGDELTGKIIESTKAIHNTLADLTCFSDISIDQKIEYITSQNESILKSTLAEEKIKSMPVEQLNELRRLYSENVRLGGTLSRYPDFDSCLRNYYLE